VTALTGLGGITYWGDDFAAAGRAYTRRLELAEAIGDPVEIAEAHYDLGFISMVNSDPEGLRAHESKALELFTNAGASQGIPKARQALSLGVFLTGDYAGALQLEGQNLAEFRAAGAEYQIADSVTFHAGVFLKSGDPEQSWSYVLDGLRWFAENANQSGIARALGMAAIVQLEHGDAELGARAAGATYRVVREKGVMLAPVKVLHLPDPRDLAISRLGAARAEELMQAGTDAPVDEVIADVLAAPSPTSPSDAGSRTREIAGT
jgi:hypothetical protein